jgi:hypothetical protein
MKRIATVALMLNLGVAGAYAEDRPVKTTPVRMTASGTLAVSASSLKPETNTDERDLAGDGTLGPFTFRELHADPVMPQTSSTCPAPQIYFPAVIGGGVFRFHDGSLLAVTLTEGSICIDLEAMMAHITATYDITRGTRRLKGASGTLTLTSTLIPAVVDTSGGVKLAMDTGKIEGTVSLWGPGQE